MNILSEAQRLEAINQPFAIASIVETKGSAPRHGARMLVRRDGSIIGTIGGGMIERHVIEQSLQALDDGNSRLIEGKMAPQGSALLAVGGDCGGAMHVFIDVYQQRPSLFLIGAGHVNQAVARLADEAGFAITVLDSYAPSLNPATFPTKARLVHCDAIANGIEQLNIAPKDFVLIATNHEDYAALQNLLDTPCDYLGLLASKRKVRHFKGLLKEQNYSKEQIARFCSPVGLDIGAETPIEIAISIVAEFLQRLNRRPGTQLTTDVRVNPRKLVVIRGAGDLASGVAIRLTHAGFKVVMLDIAHPTVIRRSVSFATALFDGQAEVEGIIAKTAHNAGDAFHLLDQGEIPVMVDPKGDYIPKLKPHFVIDAILAKHNTGTRLDMAPVTIALGPGFSAGTDVHAVIETQRGHQLGRVVYQGEAEPNTGIPGTIGGYGLERVIRSPVAGTVLPTQDIGDLVNQDECIATINGVEIPATITGKLRGMIQSGTEVPENFKIADIDPRGEKADHTTISDKARSIAGGVLEAMLHLSAQ